MLLHNVLAELPCAMILFGSHVPCQAVGFVLIALQRFDDIVSIDTDTNANYKCGHCGWMERKTVPEDCPEPDYRPCRCYHQQCCVGA